LICDRDDLELYTFFPHLSHGFNPRYLINRDLLKLIIAVQRNLFSLTGLFAVIYPPLFSSKRVAAEQDEQSAC
jgi:hypothetical protein